MRPVVLAVAVAAIAFPASAEGGWQYARWGMTPAQVVAASGGSVREQTGSGNDRIGNVQATGTYSTGGFEFASHFHFQDGKLAAVVLERSGGRSCEDLKLAMQDRYGPNPAWQPQSAWRDEDDNTTRSFIDAQGSTPCGLSYIAIKRPSLEGL